MSITEFTDHRIVSYKMHPRHHNMSLETYTS